MKVSVLIPTYNSSSVIQSTINSVLRQTSPPEEILVLDDGSTDNTIEIIKSCSSRIVVMQQQNRGVAYARNVLSDRGQGEIMAFLDHDDIWHPRYLETQKVLFAEHPDAVASFTGHVNFRGTGEYEWLDTGSFALENELIPPVEFLRRYNKCPGPFASMSYCCIRKQVLSDMGSEPFPTSVSGADDFFLFNVLPFSGSVIYMKAPLVAYRILATAQSEDQLESVRLAVKCFELIEARHDAARNPALFANYQQSFASKRRQYSKLLMGACKVTDAQNQLKLSCRNNLSPTSLMKTFALWCLTNMPVALQPRWPSRNRISNNEADGE